MEVLELKVDNDTNRRSIRLQSLIATASDRGLSLNLGSTDLSVSGNRTSEGPKVTEEIPGQTRYLEKPEEENPLDLIKTNAERNTTALGEDKKDSAPLDIFKKNRSKTDFSPEGYQQSPLAGFIMARKDELFDRVKERKISLEQSRLLSSVKESIKGLRNGITLGILTEKEANQLFMDALNDFSSTARKFEDVEVFEAFLETAEPFLEKHYRSKEEEETPLPTRDSNPPSDDDTPPLPGSDKVPGHDESDNIPPPFGAPTPPPFGGPSLPFSAKKAKIPKGVSKKAWEEMEDFYKAYGDRNDGIFPPCLWESAEKIGQNAQTKKTKFGSENSSIFKNAQKNYDKSVLLKLEFSRINALGRDGFEKNKHKIYKIFEYFKSYMPKSRGRKELTHDVSSEKLYLQTLSKIRSMLFELHYNLGLAKKRFGKSSVKKKKTGKGVAKKMIIVPDDTVGAIDAFAKKHLASNLREAIKACPHGFVSINKLQMDPSKTQEVMIGGISSIVSNLLGSLPETISVNSDVFKDELLKEFTLILKRNNALEEGDLKSPKKEGVTPKARKVFKEFALFYSNKLRKIIEDAKLLDIDSPVSPLKATADGKWGELLLFAVQEKLKTEEEGKNVIGKLRALLQKKPYEQSKPMERIKDNLRKFLKTAIQDGANDIFSEGTVVVQRSLIGDKEIINFGNWLASPMHGDIAEVKESDKLRLKKYHSALKKFMENEDQDQFIPPAYPKFQCSESTIDLEDFAGRILIERITDRFLENVEKLPKTSGPKREIDLLKLYNAPNRSGVLTSIKDVIIQNKFIFPELADSIPSKVLGSVKVDVLPEILSAFVLQQMKIVEEEVDLF